MNLYYSHDVYGSIEENAIVKIEYEGSELYNELIHEEYAGLEIFDFSFFF